MTISDILKVSQNFNDAEFTAWLKFVLKWECVFHDGQIVTENVPGDSGGLTFAGIDQASHPKFNYSNPTADGVAGVYFSTYWVPSKELAWPVNAVTANFSVNMGLKASVKLLQTAINQIPEGGWCRVDGDLGPLTISASKLESPTKLADLIEDEADERYRGIVEAKPKNKKFLAGWLNRDNALEQWWMKLPVPNSTPV